MSTTGTDNSRPSARERKSYSRQGPFLKKKQIQALVTVYKQFLLNFPSLPRAQTVRSITPSCFSTFVNMVPSCPWHSPCLCKSQHVWETFPDHLSPSDFSNNSMSTAFVGPIIQTHTSDLAFIHGHQVQSLLEEPVSTCMIVVLLQNGCWIQNCKIVPKQARFPIH